MTRTSSRTSHSPKPHRPSGRARKARILVVDDHPLFRLGLTRSIDAQPDMRVCGEASDARHALEIARKSRTEVVVTDLSLAQGNGLELIKELKEGFPDVRTVVLSMYDERLYAERVMQAGGSAYVMKDEGGEKVLTAIREALAGNIFVSERLKERLLQGPQAAQRPGLAFTSELLSDLELKIFSSIGQGQSTQQIGERLNLSVRAIVAGRERIKAKLALSNGVQLVQHALHYVHDTTGLSGPERKRD